MDTCKKTKAIHIIITFDVKEDYRQNTSLKNDLFLIISQTEMLGLIYMLLVATNKASRMEVSN